MDIKELREKRQELERKLCKLVGDEIKVFAIETGIYPNYISINLVDVNSIGFGTKRTVEDIKVGIEL